MVLYRSSTNVAVALAPSPGCNTRWYNPWCHHRALELLELGERERIRKVKEAPGLPFDYSVFEIIREKFPEDELEKFRELAKFMP